VTEIFFASTLSSGNSAQHCNANPITDDMQSNVEAQSLSVFNKLASTTLVIEGGDDSFTQHF
jgi:hypothetical protein